MSLAVLFPKGRITKADQRVFALLLWRLELADKYPPLTKYLATLHLIDSAFFSETTLAPSELKHSPVLADLLLLFTWRYNYFEMQVRKIFKGHSAANTISIHEYLVTLLNNTPQELLQSQVTQLITRQKKSLGIRG